MLSRVLLLFAAALLTAGPAAAGEVGSIEGRVATRGGKPVVGVEVILEETRRSVATDREGRFVFRGVEPGRYRLIVTSPAFGTTRREVEVAAGTAAAVEVEFDHAGHREEIVVTTQPSERSTAESYQGVEALTGDDLSERIQPTLGETLSREAGVSSTYHGPGSSRPVIRGLGGDRIRILEAGLGTGDASSTSPDHAVSVDPASLDRIEVVRGPATLLYGGSAVGGVVNLLDNRIPMAVPERAIHGAVTATLGTAADETTGSLELNGGGGSVAWHLDYLDRETEDVDIPGKASEDADVSGVLENTATETQKGSAGVSFIGERGFVGFAYTDYESLYGIPGGHDEDGTAGAAEEEEPIRIDLDQRRFDVRGEYRPTGGWLDSLNVRAGTTDYEHVELEGEEIGTRFLNETWEGRVELAHRDERGLVGIQGGNRDFEAIGEEAFVPPSETATLAAFVYEEIPSGEVTWLLGGRYETQDVTAPGFDQDHDGVSASAGLLWQPGESFALGSTLARSVKLPNSEELLSDGPHLATLTFELGDPDLGEETSLGLDVSFRKRTGQVTGEVVLFANRFDDFIFQAPNGDVDDGLPVFAYVQEDAEFLGVEIHGDVALLHEEPHHLTLEIVADYVQAELDDGTPLPRIPPLRVGAGLRYEGHGLRAGVHVRRVDRQDDVFAVSSLGVEEEPTDSYTLVGASLGYRFATGAVLHDVMLRGRNLTDEEARDHTSFLKDVAPLPGRDLILTYRVSF